MAILILIVSSVFTFASTYVFVKVIKEYKHKINTAYDAAKKQQKIDEKHDANDCESTHKD